MNETICAVSTPPGAGGIAVIRLSGPRALEIADKAWRGKRLSTAETHTAHLGTLLDGSGGELDEAVATVFRGPRSFTGEDTVEFSVHGSRWIQREAVMALVDRGARVAEPGEFTRRAFTAGRMDLSQAEAVADLIASSSRAAAKVALNQMRGGISARLDKLRKELVNLAALLELELDFSEEDVEFASRDKLIASTSAIIDELHRLLGSYRAGAAIKDGIPVAIAGATNAGKSSLLNALLGEERAIVSNIHGTTRDTIEDTIEVGDYLFRFIDTAGIRRTADTIERLGIERSLRALEQARIVLLVIDPNSPSEAGVDSIPEDAHIIRIANKCDLPHTNIEADIEVSALTGAGIESLKKMLTEIADREAGDGFESDPVLVTNARHAAALQAAEQCAQALRTGLENGIAADFLAQDLRETLHHLSTITGEITTGEILQTIFEGFCIGK